MDLADALPDDAQVSVVVTQVRLDARNRATSQRPCSIGTNRPIGW